MATVIAIISDTHMPRGSRKLSPQCVRICGDADLIIHGGDLSEVSVLEELELIGPPLMAIHGNVDSAELQELLPECLTIEIESLRLAVVHDAGPKAGRLNRMRERFPDHSAVIFGHSHLPLHEEEGGFQIFNPGSPTERRRSPFKSMGRATITGSGIVFELINLGT